MLLLPEEINPFNKNSNTRKILIAGIDEAGRGPWAGPVTAAIVVVSREQVQKLSETPLNDSKVISKKKRDLLFDLIIETVTDYAIIDIENDEIDALNILAATQKAMNAAFASLTKQPDQTFIDGYFNKPFLFDNAQCVIDGDAKFICIAAASVLAKVHRDRLMEELAVKYPEYGFEKHKGYGTKVHMEALGKFGITEIHRKSFKPIKKFL